MGLEGEGVHDVAVHLKYLPNFPAGLGSLADAREFCAGFFHEYNFVHRHSGIAWHTPASVHFGTAAAIDQARQNTITAAYHANPQRFGHRPNPPIMSTPFWINEPVTQPQENDSLKWPQFQFGP